MRTIPAPSRRSKSMRRVEFRAMTSTLNRKLAATRCSNSRYRWRSGSSSWSAALSLYRGQRATHERAADAARMHDAATAALDLIGQQLQMAAFAPLGADAGPALFGCSQGRAYGTDDVPACESLASRSDGVSIRSPTADAVSTWPTSSGAPTDCLGQAAGATVTNRFYAKASSSTSEPDCIAKAWASRRNRSSKGSSGCASAGG